MDVICSFWKGESEDQKLVLRSLVVYFSRVFFFWWSGLHISIICKA